LTLKRMETNKVGGRSLDTWLQAFPWCLDIVPFVSDWKVFWQSVGVVNWQRPLP
jgi:hypothetical protein